MVQIQNFLNTVRFGSVFFLISTEAVSGLVQFLLLTGFGFSFSSVLVIVINWVRIRFRLVWFGFCY